MGWCWRRSRQNSVNAITRRSHLFAALFGIPKASLSRDWTAFSAYTEAMTRSATLTVTPAARVMAHRLLAGTDTWLPIPASYKALTASLLPPRLREEFALPYGEAEQLAAQKLIRAGSSNLSALTLAAALCRTLSGGRTTARGENATGLYRANVQPILDWSWSPAERECLVARLKEAYLSFS